MEVVAATPNNGTVPPFHNHDVREWSRIDSLTGVLERARLETDHWTANTTNSSHKYGKVVDSRARSGADGNLKQEAKRQLEVFQSQIPGGRLQVIKTHTVSSSRWTNRSSTALESRDLAQDFEDLQLSVNPLDLSSEKSKASVGRSVGRRPPSRQRVRDESSDNQQNLPPTRNIHSTAATNLHRVSRLCHQIHDNAVKQTFGKYYHHKSSIKERQNGDGSVEITEIESDTDKTKRINGHTNLTRTKSTSSEDLHLIIPERDKSTKSIEDLEDLEQLQSWRRTSKLRRSLQFPKQNKTPPKPSDLPENSGSVRKIREDLEKGRRLTTALRGNNVDLEALDQILQSISSTSAGYSDKEANNGEKFEEPERDQVFTNKLKRNSFVTVESIQEVRGRLRRTSSPSSDIYKDNKEETDDGIVTGDSNLNLKHLADMPVTDGVQSRVRSYVYGMENILSKKTISGTGSLESRSKQLNGNSVNRNEDWYNRRKSYGFEKVHNQHEDMISSKSKNTVESSTDSGICRSSEIVVIPTAAKKDDDIYKTNEFSSDSDSEIKRVFSKSNSVLNVGSVKKYSSIFEAKENPDESWSRLGMDTSWMNTKKDIEGTTITIPIVAKTSPIFNTRKLFERELGDGSSYSIEAWQNSDDNESKKVDGGAKNCDPKLRKTSLAINTNDLYLDNEDEINFPGRKTKKVEFCKTEVHFAADSGRVNIVETDEKPPPTNNFRRRRRNSGLIPHAEDFNSNGLPVFQFGDSSYDKNLFGISDVENGLSDVNDEEYENLPNTPFGTVTVNTSANILYQDYEEELKENTDNEIPKGILKNKPLKPKPYILGDSDNYLQVADIDNQEKPWGIKLRSVKDETPIWRSTVTVRNTFYDNQAEDENYSTESSHCESYARDNKDVRDSQPEFQKMLKTLRPTKKRPESFNEGESFNGIRIVSPPIDARRSSWSVADRIKQVEELQWVENKGYSTKVNFGNGEATVIENSKQTTERHPTWPRREETSSDLARIQAASETEPPKPPSQIQYENDLTSKTDSSNAYRSKVSTRAKYSPVVLRKSYPAKNPSLRTTFDPEKLSSPSLVGLNRIKNESKTEDVKIEVETKSFVQKSNRGSLERKSHAKMVQSRSPNRIRSKSPSKDVLRQPKKSEMAYFGVPISPKSTRKIASKLESRLTEKPDLLQFNTADFKKKRNETTSAQETKKEEPIYENIEEIKKHKTKYGAKRELDSSILEELTKAADQILQAVNGYTDEDSQNKFSTDDEDRKLGYKREPLDTISETKSWKQDKNPLVKSLQNRNSTSTRTKLKHTSSTSSVESVTRECRKTTSSVKKTPSTPPSAAQKTKKKTTNGDNASAKANTKARRLQRASSREALLQSHGSSSEDLSANVEVPLRKPRLVRKTKTTQLSVTSSIEMNKKIAPGKKREDPVKGKIDERIPSVGLPEIRHKTAVSTIRSTAEKAASRDRISKSKNEELKKKAVLKRETRGPSSSSRIEKVRSTSSREIANHRISTANIKKCSRSDGLLKH